MRSFSGWDVSLATGHSILVLMLITIQITEFITEVFPLQYRGICKKFAGSAVSVKVCGLWLCSILVLL